MFFLVAVSASAGACIAQPQDVPEEVLPTSPISGTFTAESRVTLSSEMPQIELALVNLSGFVTSPGRELLSLAERANDPALATIYASASPAVRDGLEGWINDEIDKALIDGMTPRQYADEIRGLATAILGKFTIESTLAFGATNVTHSLTGLNFTPASIDILIPIGGLKADTITQLTTATLGEDGALRLGDQRFGLAFGDHAWQALGLASTVLFTSDLRTSIANAVSCPALADAVSQQCSDTCVDHKAELESFCAHSIDLLVTELAKKVAAFDLDLFRFVDGTARLLDENDDGAPDRMVDGKWNAETDIGLGPRTASVSFTAQRIR
jgi:hypothetical protein